MDDVVDSWRSEVQAELNVLRRDSPHKRWTAVRALHGRARGLDELWCRLCVRKAKWGLREMGSRGVKGVIKCGRANAVL